MYRSNLDANGAVDDFSSYHSLGGLNLLGLQDSMYLDTSSSLGSPSISMAPPSVSSATMSPPTTPLTPEPSPFGSPVTQFPMLTDNNNLNASMLSAAQCPTAAAASNNLQTQLLLQRQYQYHLLLQQQQQQLALAKQQLALAASAAAVQHQGKDEIAHSLKMFALLTACNADNGNVPLQDIMQEFAANGQVSDDFTRLQYCNTNATLLQATQPHAGTVPPLQTQRHLPAGTATPATPPMTASQWLSLNSYREQLNNVWRSMTYYNMPSATAVNPSLAAAATINNTNSSSNGLGLAVNMPMEHMRNSSSNNNKLHKRYSNLKSKEMSRRCVFCENNNEPEAVVNSHSVRDSLGRVLCPKLRTYVCPICKASGDLAHTIKYCPKKPIITMEDAIKAESFRLAKSAYFKQQMKV